MVTFLAEILTEIEKCESRALVWGLVDLTLPEMEVLDIIGSVYDRWLEDETKDDPDYGSYPETEIVEDMVSKGLLFKLPSLDREPEYRSRMSETVRLLFRLRQLFPKHENGEDWQTAKTLVSDFRFIWRPRRYPKRDIEVADFISQLEKNSDCSDEARFVKELLTTGRDHFSGLAEFQVRATESILSGFSQNRASFGRLITAGTGSGKTLAFYLPALARIALAITREESTLNVVKCLAIYPRTELMIDQFREVFQESRRLDSILSSMEKRPIRIGLLFGGTANSIASIKRYSSTNGESGWKRSGDRFVCTYLRCLFDDCQGQLVWLEADIDRNAEIIRCDSCEKILTDALVGFTRESLIENPPDILFTSTEMLNQHLGDRTYRPLFGLGGGVPAPGMVLLDEVHTYSGFHGAQVAYLIRRWRKASGVYGPLGIIGLSATLKDGEKFFSSLIGVPEYRVIEIEPKEQDLELEGAEYMVALQGDPVSRTALLSTTIQTAMLISRTQDTQGKQSEGVYGTRTFAFVDDLDVSNRLYHQLLDAEGLNDWGRSIGDQDSLARLRQAGSAAKEYHGQDWWLPRDIGHDLETKLSIGRTSSQDPGVSARNNVVVATSKLEVGFNDPEVGVVIQHKAPRDPASFLQRKGRAGRRRTMRPWTIVVLSDYGRDRICYQAQEQLFDPEISPKTLPLQSMHIKRMQAVYVLIDYLSRGGEVPYKMNVWKGLCGDEENVGVADNLIKKLEKIIQDDAQRQDFSDYLGKALQIEEDSVDAILWEYPRPMMMGVIPTALRRLKTQWKADGERGMDFKIKNSPLPEFTTASLFADLNLPEVQILLRSGEEPDQKETIEFMAIERGMSEFAPGRVTRRFGPNRSTDRHWIVPSDLSNLPVQRFDLDDHIKGNEIGKWTALENGVVKEHRVIRVLQYKPSTPKKYEVKDNSMARLDWQNQIVSTVSGLKLPVPSASDFKELLDYVELYTHADQVPAEVRRFASNSKADLHFYNKESFRTKFDFHFSGEPCALGFSQHVDGVRFKLKEQVFVENERLTSGSLANKLRLARYKEIAWEGGFLSNVENPFARQWLSTIYFTAIVHEALSSDISMESAELKVKNQNAEIQLEEILETIFQSSFVEVFEEDASDASAEVDELKAEIVTYLCDSEVRKELHELAKILWNPIDKTWEEWLRRLIKSTLGSAILLSINDLCPEVDSNDLVLDIDSGSRAEESIFQDDPGLEFWISETNPGGNGTIENFSVKYSEDPLRFYRLVSANLQSNEYEVTDFQMIEVLERLSGPQNDLDLISLFDQFRSSLGTEKTEAFASIRKYFAHSGFAVSHGFISSMTNRILREGSSSLSDDYLYKCIEYWVAQEERLGFEIDSRIIAYVKSRDDEIDDLVTSMQWTLPTTNVEAWRYNAIHGLFWPRGAILRSSPLSSYNRFQTNPEPEPLVCKALLSRELISVDVNTETSWRETIIDRLERDGYATVRGSIHGDRQLAEVLSFVSTNSVESSYLRLFACVRSVRRLDNDYEIELEVSGFEQ